MPYSTPTDNVAAPIAFPSQGRPGHRRSFSHITAPVYTSTSSSPSLSSLPRRRPTASAPPVFAAHAAPDSPHKKPTFQLGRDDDDDDNSSSDEAKTKAQQRSRVPAHDDDDRMLPPLRLKVKHGSFSGPTHRGSPPPQIALQPASPGAVPFPRSSPSPSPSPSESQSNVPFPHTRTTSDHGTVSASAAAGARLLRPSVSRTSSSPILLSNGKPLKSSLKGSSSSPNIPFPPQSLVPSIMFPDLHRHQHHQRARSAPSTPNLETVEFGSSESSSSPSPPLVESPSESPSPTMPQKNVHFPSQEEGGLATVRVFNRSAKPASLSRLGEDTETETEGESSAANNGWSGLGWNTWGMRSSRNFPRLAGNQSVGGGRGSPLSRQEEKILEVDSENSTPVPARGAEKGVGNVYLESVGFVRDVPKNPTPRRPLVLAGTLLVRNVTYQKTVAVRFTMDDWHTTNDVLATYEKSLGALPARFVLGAAGALSADASAESTSKPSSTLSPSDTRVCSPYAIDSPDDVPVRSGEAPAWDRFRFEIKLEDFAGVLEGRTMWLVGRYSASGAGLEALGAGGEEWWDNNGGMNYRVGFKRREVVEERKRGVVFSAPSVYPATPRPAATSPPTKSYPAPPQISASVSLPTSFEELKQQQQQQAQLAQQQTQSPQYTQQQHLPQQELAYIEQHLPHQAAVTQSTLARLKKLNLRNYAAPTSYVSPTSATPSAVVGGGGNTAMDNSPAAAQRTLSTSSTASSTSSIDSMDSLSTASSTTSADSTPLQTPTQDPAQANVYVHQGPRHDLDLDVLGNDASMSLQRGGPPNAVDEDGHTTDEAATPTPTPRTTRWGTGAKEFAAAVSGAGAGVFKLRLGGASPGVSRSATPTQASTNNSTSTLNANATTPDKTAAMDISSRRRGVGAMDDASMNVGIGSPSEMGTSPPFSAMADMLSGRPGGAPRPLASAASVTSPTTEAAAASSSARHGHHLYWPWGSFKAAATAEKEKVDEDDKQYSTPPEQGHEEGQELKNPPLSAPVASLLRGVKEKSAAPTPADPTSNFSGQSRLYSGNASPSPSYSSSPSPATLPHRRRTAHSSVGGGNASGSPSSSGSESGRRTHYRRVGSGGSGSSSPLAPSASLLSQGPPPLSSSPLPMSPSNSMVWGMRPGSPRPGSPRPSGVAGGNGVSGVRSPLRMSPVHSFADLGAAAVAVAGISGTSSPTGATSIGGGSITTESGSATSSSSSPPTSPAAQDDPLYQAFVRQWCFAQAPGPTVGASVANAGVGAPGGPGAGASMPMSMSGVERGVGEPRLAVK